MSKLLGFFFVVATISIGIEDCPRALSRNSLVSQNCAVIEGRVINERGLPVNRATVHSFLLDRPPRARGGEVRTETDQNGTFSLSCVDAGLNGVYVGKEDEYYPDTLLTPFIDAKSIPLVSVPGGRFTKHLEIRIGPKGGRITGKIFDSISHQPIDSAILTICQTSHPKNCRPLNANLTREGFSQLLPAWTFMVKALAPGYEAGTSILVELKPSSVKTLMIPLKRNTKVTH